MSAQPLLGLYGSDTMALSMIVGIPDLAYIYMESMETATSNVHVYDPISDHKAATSAF